MSTVDIEKQSLEAHVELCAERYGRLEEKIDQMDKRVSVVEHMLSEIKGLIVIQNEKRNSQIIGWGVGLIAFLGTTAGTLAYLLLQS